MSHPLLTSIPSPGVNEVSMLHCRAPRPSEQARADFSPPTGGQEWFQMVMQSMLKQYSRDFGQRVRSDRFGPCVTAAPHRRRTSEHVSQQKFEHEGMHPDACSAPLFHACMSHHYCCSGQVASIEVNQSEAVVTIVACMPILTQLLLTKCLPRCLDVSLHIFHFGLTTHCRHAACEFCISFGLITATIALCSTKNLVTQNLLQPFSCSESTLDPPSTSSSLFLPSLIPSPADPLHMFGRLVRIQSGSTCAQGPSNSLTIVCFLLQPTSTASSTTLG